MEEKPRRVGKKKGAEKKRACPACLWKTEKGLMVNNMYWVQDEPFIEPAPDRAGRQQ
jgi:hypothetical protein